MIQCDTDEERKALKMLTWAVYEVIYASVAVERKKAKARLVVAYDKMTDVVIGMKKPSGSTRYHRGD